MKETYLSQGICMNCGYKNYPQWGTYEKGKTLNEYPCPSCNCMTWTKDYMSEARVGTTSNCTPDQVQGGK